LQLVTPAQIAAMRQCADEMRLHCQATQEKSRRQLRANAALRDRLRGRRDYPYNPFMTLPAAAPAT
jgi:hypothetical protein